MKFVDITENYKVNLEAIFSLEKRVIPNKEECERYNDQLDIISAEITENPPSLMCSGQLYNPLHDTNAKDNPLFKEYEKKLKEYLYNQVGEQPPLYRYEYYAILCTGVKVQLAENKYEAIIKAIEEIDIKKMEKN